MEELPQQALTEHLAELRQCLIVSLLAVLAGFAGAYAFIEPLAAWYLAPLHAVLPPGTSLVYTAYQEGFFFI